MKRDSKGKEARRGGNRNLRQWAAILLCVLAAVAWPLLPVIWAVMAYRRGENG